MAPRPRAALAVLLGLFASLAAAQQLNFEGTPSLPLQVPETVAHTEELLRVVATGFPTATLQFQVKEKTGTSAGGGTTFMDIDMFIVERPDSSTGTGVLKRNAARFLNFDQKSTWELKIEARNTADNSMVRGKEFTVNILDRDAHPKLQIHSGGDTLYIPQLPDGGVLREFEFDMNVTYVTNDVSLIIDTGSDAGSLVRIEANGGLQTDVPTYSGSLFTLKLLDYTFSSSDSWPRTLTMRAGDQAGREVTANFKIQPTAFFSVNSPTVSLNENPPADTEVAVITVQQQHGKIDDQYPFVVTKLSATDSGNFFRLNLPQGQTEFTLTKGSSVQPKVLINQCCIDYESTTTLTPRFVVTSKWGEVHNADVTVNVQDVVNEVPTMEASSITFPESTAVGTTVGFINITYSPKWPLTAKIADGQGPPFGSFTVLNAEGTGNQVQETSTQRLQLRVNQVFDYEKLLDNNANSNVFVIKVELQDQDGLTGTVDVSVTVQDVGAFPCAIPQLRPSSTHTHRTICSSGSGHHVAQHHFCGEQRRQRRVHVPLRTRQPARDWVGDRGETVRDRGHRSRHPVHRGRAGRQADDQLEDKEDHSVWAVQHDHHHLRVCSLVRLHQSVLPPHRQASAAGPPAT